VSVCRCGHPQERHLFGTGSCTVIDRDHETASIRYCHCDGYEEKTVDESAAFFDDAQDRLRGEIA
jgi:hypothetical protein